MDVFDFNLDEGCLGNLRHFYSLMENHQSIIDGVTVNADAYEWFALNEGIKGLANRPEKKAPQRD